MPEFLPSLTIGCDPEIFLTKDGKAISAHGLIKGTKYEPFNVDRGAVQVDGTALEFNIQPANTVDIFCFSIKSVMASLRSMVPEYNFDFNSSRTYPKDYFDSLPKEAKELGCEPDYNAWTMSINPSPDPRSTFRTIAGHVHLGWLAEPADEEEHFYDCIEFVKQLDYCIGVPSIIIDNSDTSRERRKLYGKAGSFRPRPNYGLEYRVLSPFWLTSEERMRWLFGSCQFAYNQLKIGYCFSNHYGDYARNWIDNSDIKAAKEFVESFNWELPK